MATLEELAREERLLQRFISFPRELQPVSTFTGSDLRKRSEEYATIQDFCKVAILPYWGEVYRLLCIERESRGQLMIARGVEDMLNSLHPSVRWNPPFLEISNGEDRNVFLRGKGLLLCPALFLTDRVHVVQHGSSNALTPVLIFPVSHISGGTLDLRSPEDHTAALGALIGHTRTAALQALSENCSTSVLSKRLGISVAGASKHATILRKAGLITTSRVGSTCMHGLTPLGLALLQRRNE